MKHLLPYLEVGAEVEGVVQEVLPSGELIVSFSGDLARVHNNTEFHFEAGHHIPLQVVNLRPLQLRFHADRHLQSQARARGHLDTRV